MTAFARALKCGARGARGSRVSSASKPSCRSRLARPSRPKPLPAFARSSRRVQLLFDIDKLVEAKEGLTEVHSRGELGVSVAGIAVALFLGREELVRLLPLPLAGRSPQRLPIET